MVGLPNWEIWSRQQIAEPKRDGAETDGQIGAQGPVSSP